MSDPLRHVTDSEGLSGPGDEAGREARIEQLLLAGLDHYFCGRHEQAIDVWSRVAFLERRHGRARAYIERARTALAERQRECDELMHRGIAAYHDGDLGAARELLTRAIAQGGPTDTALAFLQRLGRIESVPAAAGPTPDGHAAVPAEAASRPPVSWPATIAASAAVVAAVLLVALPLTSFLAESPVPVPTVEPAAPEPLPVAHPSERVLVRARELQAGGRVREALAALAAVGPADARADDANRLRGDLQRALLAGVDAELRGDAATGAAEVVR
jgi:hypothetical protein